MLLGNIAIIYTLLCFLIGFSCFSVIVYFTKSNKLIIKGFCLFYFAFTFNVFTALLYQYSLLPNSQTPQYYTSIILYLYSFIGHYLLMFSWPFFVHRLVGLKIERADANVAFIVMFSFFVQHVTEFALSDFWDGVGDVFEDVVAVSILLYSFRVLLRHKGAIFNVRVLPFHAFIITLIVVGDFFWEPIYIYPFSYAFISVAISWTLIKQDFVKETIENENTMEIYWGLTEREKEVYQLIKLGLANKDIAEKLNVSLNTVKTHVTAIFDKSGIRSRVGLLAISNKR